MYKWCKYFSESTELNNMYLTLSKIQIKNQLNFVWGHYLTGETQCYPYLLKLKKIPTFVFDLVFFKKLFLPRSFQNFGKIWFRGPGVLQRAWLVWMLVFVSAIHTVFTMYLMMAGLGISLGGFYPLTTFFWQRKDFFLLFAFSTFYSRPPWIAVSAPLAGDPGLRGLQWFVSVVCLRLLMRQKSPYPGHV